MAEAVVLPRSSPESRGIRSASIHEFIDAADRDIRDLHSVMLLRHGHVVAEGWWDPCGPAEPHMLFSLSKSFTSTAIGLLVTEGKLAVDDLVLSFFPEEAPATPEANARAMRVRHLLSMTAGHDTDPTEAVFRQTTTDWVRAFFAQPVPDEPGSRFVYNTAATYMLSAIVQKLTGARMLDYLRPRLFEPLGIANPVWDTSPQGIDVGGSGLHITTEDIARFGQLYLQHGLLQGKQLIPASWITEATVRQVDNGPSPNIDWVQGYGYQFWRCQHGAYRGDGAFGQFCVVMPDKDAVLAITAGVSNMQAVLDLVWKHLLPALEPETLSEDYGAQNALTQRLRGLRLNPQPGKLGAQIAAQVSGKTFALADNADNIKALTFDFGEHGCTLTSQTDHGEQQVTCGSGAWVRGDLGWGRDRLVPPGPIAASGAWRDDRTYVARILWYRTPFARTLTCRFDGDRVHVKQQMNVSFGSTDRPRLEGRLVASAVV
jgi:CubicO group peptidase (beta-lactamase class C family)